MTPIFHTLGKKPGKSRSQGAGSEAPPAPTTSEPVFNAALDTLQYQDDMTKYTSALEMWNDRNDGTTRWGQPDPPPSSSGEEPASNLWLSPGRNGSTGAMLSCIYTGTPNSGGQEGHGWWLRNIPSTPTLATHVVQYWFRMQLSAPLDVITDTGTDELAIKFIELNHPDGDRIQWNTHDYLPGSPTGRLSNCMWESLDDGNDNGSHQAVEPSATTVFNSSQWYRLTHRYRSNSAVGARDGVSQMWAGQGALGTATKIIDISAATLNITPPGGWRPWCTTSDLDAIAANMGVVFMKLASVLTNCAPQVLPFQMYWTEFLWWTEN